MYPTILALHSVIRWLILIFLAVTIYKSYRGFKRNLAFAPLDNQLRVATVIVAHAQLILGVFLYFSSPIVSYFLNNFGEAVHQREIRFFGMEHVTVMILAVILITIGSVKTKQKITDFEKHKTLFKWYGWALIAILTSIPWAFSPLVHRPYFRPF